MPGEGNDMRHAKIAFWAALAVLGTFLAWLIGARSDGVEVAKIRLAELQRKVATDEAERSRFEAEQSGDLTAAAAHEKRAAEFAARARALQREETGIRDRLGRPRGDRELATDFERRRRKPNRQPSKRRPGSATS